MTPSQLAVVLGEPPAPTGSWEREAAYVSAVPARAPDPAAAAHATAARLRGLPGVAGVRVRPGGLVEIVVAVPGRIVDDVTARPCAIATAAPAGWPDHPRTWDNPGFVVRYAHARAVAVGRWARDLGVGSADFRPRELGHDPCDRAVLRVLGELPSRRRRTGTNWPLYLERLALAYHDAHERAPALPSGDAEPLPVHAARLRLARAVRVVLAAGLAAIGQTAPDRL